MSLTQKHFEHWLRVYGGAWEASASTRFASLFEENAIYYWAPFDDPIKGRDAIQASFNEAASKQRDVDFGARVLYVESSLGAAHWTCSYTRATTGKRVHVDGILVVQFSDSGRALSFREWWHSDEGR